MSVDVELPGLDCGLCGFRKCSDLATRLEDEPALLERCIHVAPKSPGQDHGGQASGPPGRPWPTGLSCDRPEVGPPIAITAAPRVALPTLKPAAQPAWQDSLGREFDFYLEHFPEEPGPRECILPHNPLITREMNVQPGDLLIGRPLGMSCGCPITHCGVAMDVDPRTGVINWCVTGPLRVRQEGFKNLGYYIAEAYDGLIRNARTDVRIGCRYFFQPRMCMLQWRHSGLVNFLNKTADGLQVRLEGLWIG